MAAPAACSFPQGTFRSKPTASRRGFLAFARVLHPRAPASRSARVRRRAPLLGGRLACRAVAPYHVVKMRDTRSLRVFNENYPLSRSFSLRVVGVYYTPTPPCEGIIPSRYFRRQTFISATPAMKRRLHSSCSPHFVIAGALSPRMSLKARKYPWGSAPSHMRGCYTLALPHYLFVTRSNTRFVKELRRKISRAKPAKIFAPLTTTSS